MCTKEEKLLFDISVILLPLFKAEKEDTVLAYRYAVGLSLLCKEFFKGLTKEEKRND